MAGWVELWGTLDLPEDFRKIQKATEGKFSLNDFTITPITQIMAMGWHPADSLPPMSWEDFGKMVTKRQQELRDGDINGASTGGGPVCR
jgi:hypothetical protein